MKLKNALLGLIILTLAACNTDNGGSSNNASQAGGATTSAPAASVSATQAKTINLVVSPKVNQIDLQWHSTANAVSYTVYQLRPTSDLDAYSSNTDQTRFSVMTNGQETYQLWITAQDKDGNTINQSQKVTVTSSNSRQKLALEEAP